MSLDEMSILERKALICMGREVTKRMPVHLLYKILLITHFKLVWENRNQKDAELVFTKAALSSPTTYFHEERYGKNITLRR